MIANYFNTAIRNLLKSRTYSFINIFGLAIGLACLFLILQYLQQEIGYDRFHAGAEDIYRIAWADENPQTRTPHPMAQALVQDFPEVESAVSLTPLWGVGLTRETFSFRNLEKDIRFDERNVIAVDTTFFDVFTFPLLRGDPKTVLKNPGGLLVSASMAVKYFGDEDPMGKRLEVNGEKQLLEVLGVFADVPPQSHLHFDFLVSYVREKSFEDPDSQYYTWNDFGHYNYIRLKPGANAKQLEGKLTDWIRKYINVSDEAFRAMREKNFGFRLQPLTDIHLHSHLRWELEPNGYIAYVYIMTAAGLLILFIACVNFINLTSAQSAGRAKEIGIRKSLGAFRSQLAIQFIGESLLVSLLAMVVATVLIELSIPFFTSVTGSPMKIDYLFFAAALGGLTVLTGLVAGAFPSLYLAAAKPSLILKGRFLQNPRGSGFRQYFTVLQFFASMILLSSSVIIFNQLDFIQHKELGFRGEEVVTITVKDRDAITPRLEELRSDLMKIRGIAGVSAASNIPGSSFNQNPVFATTNPQNRVACSEEMVDYDFLQVMGISMVAGRAFSRQNPADREAFLINETAAKNLFPDGAIGKELSWDYDEGLLKGTVIGIVKDFNFQSLHQPVRPLLFRLAPRFNYVVVRLSPTNFAAQLKSIEEVWKKFDTQFAFEFSFLNDQLQLQYTSEKNMSSVLSGFSVIALVVAAFGLLGMATITFTQRIKEVSVRKVLGATIPGLIMMLLRDYTRLVLIAVVLAVPLVWWVMDQWLGNFTFRTTINPLIFPAAGAILLALAWATLSYLTLKIARVNPAESLKNE